MQENENSNSDLLASGRNPVGIIARLNRHHGWNSPYTNNGTKSQQNVQALPSFQESDTKQLCVNDKQFKQEGE